MGRKTMKTDFISGSIANLSSITMPNILLYIYTWLSKVSNE